MIPSPLNLKKLVRLVLPAALAIAAGGCAGPSFSYKKSLVQDIAAQNYTAALKKVDESKSKQYGSKNMLLYHLDRGLLLHEAGQYKESDKSFDDAEILYDELYTKSLTGAAGTLFINDNTAPYYGKPYDKSLMHVFRALNYAYTGDIQGGLVEVRKLNLFFRGLRDKNSSGYRDDAFAEYLGGLLYQANGNTDDARISFNAAADAYKWYQRDYKVSPPPVSTAAACANCGEVIFLHYNGVSPIMVSHTIQVAWNEAVFAVRASDSIGKEDSAKFENAIVAGVYTNAITVALPGFEDIPYAIKGSEVFVDSQTYPTVLMEDIGMIEKKLLAQNLTAITLRASARAMLKYVLGEMISNQVQENQGDALGLLAKVVTSAAAAGTEVADTRSWVTLPDQLRMARIQLPPGRHNLHLTFKTADGSSAGDAVLKDIEVTPGQKTFVHYRTAD